MAIDMSAYLGVYIYTLECKQLYKISYFYTQAECWAKQHFIFILLFFLKIARFMFFYNSFCILIIHA